MDERESSSNNQLVPEQRFQNQLLPGELQKAGQAASRAAAKQRFRSYQQRRAEETLRRQKADLGLFGEFLCSFNLETGDFFNDPAAWSGITWGLIEAFVKWQIDKGYAVPTINVRLSTLKTYSRLAMQAGTISPQEYALIRSIQGFSQQEKRRIDSRRTQNRVGLKKSSPVLITPKQAALLKNQPETAQGRRDTLLICLLLDHGLRVGELAGLAVEDLDLNTGILHFFRPKVGKNQTHRLSRDTHRAAQVYHNLGDMPQQGPLLRRSHKDGSLGKQGMTERAITQRVKDLGAAIGLSGLSAHDCRHYWATSAARHGTDPFVLQEAGGWSSLAMPRRYVQENEIANEGIQLD